jgi:tubulin-specific chaperone D
MVENKKELEQIEDEDNDDNCSKSKHLYHFKEYDIAIELIDNLPENIKVLCNEERAYEKFSFICDSYQEQPHLVDPVLGEIFEKFINLIKNTLSSTSQVNDKLIHECFKYMYCLTKMRGYKKILQHLPHEINDLEPVLNLLSRQDMKDYLNWQTRYLLLLWLSIVCMVPFDLERFDDDKSKKIVNRILDVCIVSLIIITIYERFLNYFNFYFSHICL